MNTEYKTIKVPFFNNFKGLNIFKIEENKFIAEQQIEENTKIDNGLLSIGKKITSLRYEFILPKGYTQNLDFESDVTITYEAKNNKLFLINIDALYADDYIENIESNNNVYPVYKNGYISYISDYEDTDLNTAC